MFQNARLKLTAWYLLIIMLISLSFSFVIFQMLSNEIERITRVQRFRIERGVLPPNDVFTFPPSIDIDIVNESRHRLLLTLITINGSIFAVTGVLGYFLAGQTLRPIKQMLDEQNRFISDSSHELRTPLTSLKSAFEVNLRDKGLTIKDARTLISESIDEVNKLQSLSDELLQLAQYEKPNGNTKFEIISLRNVIERSVKKINPIAKQKDITIKTSIKDINIEGNDFGLTDLFTILLDNAVKYSYPKKIISVISDRNDGYAIVSVRDRGIGIDKKDQPHVFDRFYRADSARTRSEAGGYGLGLSIAKKIVDIHRGQISIVSTPGRGSTFTVRLPVKHSFS
jgi:signal transduction histidine kinase